MSRGSDKNKTNIFPSFSLSPLKESFLEIDNKNGPSLQHQCINQNIEKSISPDVISKIQKYLLSHEPFDSGTEGVVYKVPVKIDGGISYFLVTKKRYDHDVTHEYSNHKYLSTILATPHDFKQYVDIPKLYGKFDDATQNESYIIMDYIQGKTFFATLVEKISGIVVKCDKQAEKILKDIFLQKKGYSASEFTDLVVFLKEYIQNNSIKLFSFQEGMNIKNALKNFINYIHQKGFYHRDIGNNLRNIIIGDDKKIYIIDFGCSVIVDKNTKNLDPDDIKEIYHFAYKNGIEHLYAYDETFLNTIDMLTNKPPKKESREL